MEFGDRTETHRFLGQQLLRFDCERFDLFLLFLHLLREQLGDQIFLGESGEIRGRRRLGIFGDERLQRSALFLVAEIVEIGTANVKSEQRYAIRDQMLMLDI